MNRMAPLKLLELLHDGLEPLLEVAAIARAGDQRAHVERKDGAGLETSGTSPLDDLARKTFGDRRLADAGIADEQRIVLLPAAEDLDRALDFRLAPDQRIDAALCGLVVEIDAIGFERVLGACLTVFSPSSPSSSAPRTCLRLGHAGTLGDAVADVVHRVEARHVLFLQEVGGVAFALGEDRDQHVGAGHFLAAGRLHVHHGALHDRWKPVVGFASSPSVDDQASRDRRRHIR